MDTSAIAMMSAVRISTAASLVIPLSDAGCGRSRASDPRGRPHAHPGMHATVLIEKLSAIDMDRLPSHMVGFVAGQENRQVGDVLRRGDAPERDLTCGRLQLRLRHPMAGLRGVGDAGRDGIDAYAVAGKIQGRGAGQTD